MLLIWAVLGRQNQSVSTTSVQYLFVVGSVINANDKLLSFLSLAMNKTLILIINHRFTPHTYSIAPQLNINITKGPAVTSQLIMRLQQRDRPRQPLQINDRLGRVRSAAATAHSRHVGHAGAATRRYSIEALVWVLHLPDPPQTVERAVMEVEDGVAGGRGRVAAGVNGVDIMTGGMDLLFGKFISSVVSFGVLGRIMSTETYAPGIEIILGRRIAQQLVVKVVDIAIVGDQAVRAVGRGAHGGVAVDVAAQAAWVRTGAVGPWVLRYVQTSEG